MTNGSTGVQSPSPLRILIVEDDASDADIMIRELHRAGFAPEWERVEDEAGYLAALTRPFDIIISDYRLPQFSAVRALELLQEVGKGTPLIVVTGAVGEETAVDFIKRGAVDYLLKDRLTRQGLAVRQALEQCRLREAERHAGRLLVESQMRLEAIVNNAQDATFVINDLGQYVDVNPASLELTGYSRAELLTMSVWDLSSTPDVQEGWSTWQRVLDEGRASGEYLLRRKDGMIVDVEFRSVSNVLPNLHISACRDISVRKQADARMSRLAYYDHLTGLPNRSLYIDRVRHALVRADRSRKSVAVLFLDLDNFKVINDSVGHAVGDRVLTEVARRLHASVRAGDTAARIGGDEFAILLEEVGDAGNARDVVDRVLQALHRPIRIGANEFCPTFSVGVTVSAPGDESVEEMLRHADLAMYRAKANGRAQYVMFDQIMKSHATDQLTLDVELRKAIAQGELSLDFQPIVDLKIGRVAEVEALLRWKHPRLGSISPARFIPVAEETGLIVPIGQWVLEQACRQAQSWRTNLPDFHELIMSVNLSARQFRHPQLVSDVARVLRETGLAPEALKLEITESVLMQRMDDAIATMHEIKGRGVHLAIDDFGTGYSSLAYLKHFPVDTLKIDGSFVHGFPRDHRDLAIIQSVIALARGLDLTVTAEGVETIEQLTELQELGCDQAQGYYLARPAPAGVLSTLFERGGPLVKPYVLPNLVTV